VALTSLTFEGEFYPPSELSQLSANVLDSFETSSEDEDQEVPHQNMERKEVYHKNISGSSNFTSVLFPEFFEKLEGVKKEAVNRE
jgi:hypothetical protein